MNILCFYLLRSLPGFCQGRFFTKISFLCIKILKQKLTYLAQNLSKQQNKVMSSYNVEIAEYFEQTVNIIKSLTEYTLGTKMWSKHSLSEAFAYIDECELMLKRLKVALALQGPTKKSSEDLTTATKKRLRSYCYCCSKPIFRFLQDKLALVYENNRELVPACNDCHKSMRVHQTLNILHFTEEQKRKHWSQVRSYLPSWDLWQMNSVNANSINNK
jgi:hypothetical protein